MNLKDTQKIGKNSGLIPRYGKGYENWKILSIPILENIFQRPRAIQWWNDKGPGRDKEGKVPPGHPPRCIHWMISTDCSMKLLPMGEIEYLFISTYEREKQNALNFHVNEALVLFYKKLRQWSGNNPELVPYYRFLLTSLEGPQARTWITTSISWEWKDSLKNLKHDSLSAFEVQFLFVLETNKEQSTLNINTGFFGYDEKGFENQRGNEKPREEFLRNLASIRSWKRSMAEQRIGRLHFDEISALFQVFGGARQTGKKGERFTPAKYTGIMPGNRDLSMWPISIFAWFLWKNIETQTRTPTREHMAWFCQKGYGSEFDGTFETRLPPKWPDNPGNAQGAKIRNDEEAWAPVERGYVERVHTWTCCSKKWTSATRKKEMRKKVSRREADC